MKEKEIAIPVRVYSYDELEAADRKLVDAAREATGRSYAPYSKFRVGAAIRLDNGQVVTGSNQENAAFPSGTCAERTACYYAGSKYPSVGFEALAVSAVTPAGGEIEEPVAPCGACRQALLEYEKLSGHPVRVLLVGKEAIYELPSVKSLLPLAFTEF
ncbi:MAG: cytidine deaminase [Muribaculaceae bacterium]|nr:cytidine deaminase [Muribaculaceae bacterium]